jgi:hypothetical protein
MKPHFRCGKKKEKPKRMFRARPLSSINPKPTVTKICAKITNGRVYRYSFEPLYFPPES